MQTPSEVALEMEALREKCESFFEEWRMRMGLNWWDITYNYYSDTGDFIRDHDRIVLMQCSTDWTRINSVIDVCVPALSGKTDKQIERTVVHELVHILVNEMAELDDPDSKHQERVVSLLTKAFMWTRELTQDEFKEKENARKSGHWFTP